MKYQIILADPPWSYHDKLILQNEGAVNHYPTMSLENIKNLPIKDICNENCILFLWVTMPLLQEGLDVIKAWSFNYKTCAFCWIKTNPKANTIFKGIGRWVMGNAELCLLAIRGHPHRIAKNISQVVLAHRRNHSQKPDEVKNRIVSLMGNLSRIELFAREKTEGWDAIGYDIDGRDIKDSLIEIINK